MLKATAGLKKDEVTIEVSDPGVKAKAEIYLESGEKLMVALDTKVTTINIKE